MTGTAPDKAVIRTMYAGLGLTIVAMVFPIVDRAAFHVLFDHIQASYPTYATSEISTAVTTYVVILAACGVFGVAGWLWTARLVKAGKPYARWVATAIFVVAVSIAAMGLVTTDTSGDVGLAPLLGWIAALPCVAGLAVVTLLWTKSRLREQ